MAEDPDKHDSKDHLAAARDRLDEGDAFGAVRELRFAVDGADPVEVGRIVERAATMVDLPKLATPAAALVAAPGDPQALYNFGYACVEYDLAYLAVPSFTTALRLAPEERAILTELVLALQAEGRYVDAVRVLEEHEELLRPWPEGYLLTLNALLAGDLARAGRYFTQLPEPDDTWRRGHRWVRGMLDRVTALSGVSPLDSTDLRGWHFALNAGVLGTLSQDGFAAGMTGRYALVTSTYGMCLQGLSRLRVVLEAAGRRPATVSLLSDRPSQILGLAAATVLDLPAKPWTPERPDTVVVAYDLRGVHPEIQTTLRERAPGQILMEHATCWTEPPAVAADFSTLLHQVHIAPWDNVVIGPDREASGTASEKDSGTASAGSPGRSTPVDERPVELVVADILAADPTPYPGDGETPADPDEKLATFVSRIADRWLPDYGRTRLFSPGPVESFRFL